MYHAAKWIVLSGLFLLLACSDDNKDNTPAFFSSHHIAALCQGSWGLSNGALQIYDIEARAIIRDLTIGDVLNQGIIHGDQLYLASYGNHSVYRVDLNTMELAQNALLENSGPQAVTWCQNRLFVAADDKDSVLVLDPITLQQTGAVAVGEDPGWVLASNSYVYCANYAYDHYDPATYSSFYNAGSISVIDPINRRVVSSIDVGTNPTSMVIYNRVLYVMCTGDYASIPSTIYRINIDDNRVIDSLALNQYGVTKINIDAAGYFYSITMDMETYKNSIIRYLPAAQPLIVETYLSRGDAIAFKDEAIIVTRIPNYTEPGWLYHYNTNKELIDSTLMGVAPGYLIP